MSKIINDYTGFAGLLNNSTAGVMNNSTAKHGADNADLLKGTHYVDELLDTLQQTATEVHTNLFEKVTVPGEALTITFTRDDASRAIQVLQEGIPPIGGTLSSSTISFGLAQFGGVYYATDVSEIKLRVDPYERVISKLVRDLKMTRDEMARDTLHRDAGIRVLATITDFKFFQNERVAISSDPAALPTKISDLTAKNIFNYWDLESIRSIMQGLQVYMLGDKLDVTLSSSAMLALQQDVYITAVNSLSQTNKLDITQPNITTFSTFNFHNAGVSSKSYAKGELVSDMGTGADNIAPVPLDATIVTAPNFGVILNRPNKVEFFVKQLGATGGLDPIDQIKSTGIKFWLGCGIHTPTRVAILYSAQTNVGIGAGNTGIDLAYLPAIELPQSAHLLTGVKAVDAIKTIKTLIAHQIINFQPSIQDGTPLDGTTFGSKSLEIGDVINNETGKVLEDADLVLDDLPLPIYKLNLSVKVSGTGMLKNSTVVQFQMPIFKVDPTGLINNIMQPDLGPIAMGGATPTDIELFVAILAVNREAPRNFANYVFTDITATQAKVSVNGIVGDVILTYTKKAEPTPPGGNTAVKK